MQFSDKLDLFKSKQIAIISDRISSTFRSIIFAPAKDIAVKEVNTIIEICANNLFVALTPQRASSFLLSPMSRPRTSVSRIDCSNTKISGLDLNMCISVEAREGVTTGISAADRTVTINTLGEDIPNPRKLVKPGHVFPIVTREGGVLVNHALPEGALDIVKLSGFSDAALFSDILNRSGEFSVHEEIENISKHFSIPHFTLSEITQYRLENEVLITRMAEAKLPTKEAGELRAIIYKSKVHEGEHLALVKGNINQTQPVLTRIQLECTFADVFGGNNPPSRLSLKKSLQLLGSRDNGVLIYLRRPFRGVLKEQVSDWKNFYNSESSSMIREYGIGSQILLDLGIKKIELLTNSPRDYSGVKSFGLEIISQVPLDTK